MYQNQSPALDFVGRLPVRPPHGRASVCGVQTGRKWIPVLLLAVGIK